MTPEELVDQARVAQGLSYSPYSHFEVGAALLCKNGKVYLGANVENSSYGLSMCAERNAIYHALMEGESAENFEALAIIGDTPDPISPCGACRQVLSEFCSKDMPIYMANESGQIYQTNVEDLLPYAFEGDVL